jgi:hypothetical protein
MGGGPHSPKHHRKTTDITNLLQNTTLSEGSSTEPSFEKRDNEGLDAFRGLSKSSNLVLFTPAIPSNADIDPFETLGRALSSYHSRVRHVPYLPLRGMTTTHSSFCTTAGSVVVVVCQLVQTYGQVSGANLEGQQNFIRAIKDLATTSNVPIVLVEIGEGGCSHDFSTVVKCDGYTDKVQKKIAELIFKG